MPHTQDLQQVKNTKLLNAAVIVAALGYFVDVYDLLLFSIVRIISLKDILKGTEVGPDTFLNEGIFLHNMQMIGMLIGGVLWGVLGDKKGRLSVLFGSIFTYSVANIANGFVHSVESYALWRLIAGIGLAGELGAGITLVTEIMPRETRGYATTIVASIGIMGAIFAGFIAKYFDWRTCYFIGGGLGLLLLLLRIGVTESGMFQKAKDHRVKHGDFLSLFKSRRQFGKYIRVILIAIPTWFVIGILVQFSPELSKALHIQGEVVAGTAIIFCYTGLVMGDIVSGLLSQYLRSRRKVVAMFLVSCCFTITAYFTLQGISVTAFYFVCLAMGLSAGFWVIFMTVAAEQFGTNIRATVTTTVPNFVRGAIVPISLIFRSLIDFQNIGIIGAAIITGVATLTIAFYALIGMKETFGRDMDFVEQF